MKRVLSFLVVFVLFLSILPLTGTVEGASTYLRPVYTVYQTYRGAEKIDFSSAGILYFLDKDSGVYSYSQNYAYPMVRFPKALYSYHRFSVDSYVAVVSATLRGGTHTTLNIYRTTNVALIASVPGTRATDVEVAGDTVFYTNMYGLYRRLSNGSISKVASGAFYKIKRIGEHIIAMGAGRFYDYYYRTGTGRYVGMGSGYVVAVTMSGYYYYVITTTGLYMVKTDLSRRYKISSVPFNVSYGYIDRYSIVVGSNYYICSSPSGLYAYTVSSHMWQRATVLPVDVGYKSGRLMYILANNGSAYKVDISKFDAGLSVLGGTGDLEDPTWRPGVNLFPGHTNVAFTVRCKDDMGLFGDVYKTFLPPFSSRHTIYFSVDRHMTPYPSDKTKTHKISCSVSTGGFNPKVYTLLYRIRLPQMSFEEIGDRKISVSKDGQVADILKVSNAGDGMGYVSCKADVSWISLDGKKKILAGKSATVSLKVDRKHMPDSGVASVSCSWAGGNYTMPLALTKTQEKAVSVVRLVETVSVASALQGIDILRLSGLSLPASGTRVLVSTDKDFISLSNDSVILKAGESATITMTLDFGRIKRSDITFPMTTVNVSVSYMGKAYTYPVKIKINRVMKLSVPKDRLDRHYKIWTGSWKDASSSDSAPFINPLYNRTYVPLRLVSEGLGLSVGWDGNERLITITDDKMALQIDVKNVHGKKVKIVGKRETLFEAENRYVKVGKKSRNSITYERTVYVDPSVIWNSRTYVPVRFIAEMVGSLVFWDGTSREVIIYR